MNNTQKRRKICDSWYHQKWFRFILVIVGIDIFILGFTIAAGVDIFTFLSEMHLVLKIVIGFLYILVASFIIHYAIDYEDIRNKAHFTCHYCGNVNNTTDLDKAMENLQDEEDLEELEKLKDMEVKKED